MIRTLEISNADFVKVDPAEDHRAFHKQSIINLRKRINNGLASRKFPISSFDSFTSEMDIESHLSGVGASILEAYRNKQFFDFGTVDDNAIKSLSSETNTRPIATPPWDGQSAVFAAFHPDTIGYNCTSLYIMQLLDDQIVVLTEAGYYQGSRPSAWCLRREAGPPERSRGLGSSGTESPIGDTSSDVFQITVRRSAALACVWNLSREPATRPRSTHDGPAALLSHRRPAGEQQTQAERDHSRARCFA